MQQTEAKGLLTLLATMQAAMQEMRELLAHDIAAGKEMRACEESELTRMAELIDEHEHRLVSLERLLVTRERKRKK